MNVQPDQWRWPPVTTWWKWRGGMEWGSCIFSFGRWLCSSLRFPFMFPALLLISLHASVCHSLQQHTQWKSRQMDKWRLSALDLSFIKTPTQLNKEERSESDYFLIDILTSFPKVLGTEGADENKHSTIGQTRRWQTFLFLLAKNQIENIWGFVIQSVTTIQLHQWRIN